MIKVVKNRKMKFPNWSKKEISKSQIQQLQREVSDLASQYSSDDSYDRGYHAAIEDAVREISRLLRDGSSFQPPSYSPFDDALANGQRYFCCFSVDNPKEVSKRVKIVKSRMGR